MPFHTQRPFSVPIEDGPIHTDHDQSCNDSATYPNNVDPALLSEVARQVQDGLLTQDEATRTVLGHQL